MAAHPPTERASCLHCVARSRRQGHYEKRLKQMALPFHHTRSRASLRRPADNLKPLLQAACQNSLTYPLKNSGETAHREHSQ